MKRLVVISVDALFTSDLDKIKDYPGFKEVLNNSVIVKNIESVYPSVTYPCHASIMTGCHVKNHGINHNEIFNPSINNAKWYWNYEHLTAKTIFDYARENNLTTAALSWPVTAKAPIDYVLPEIWTLAYQKSNIEILNSASKKAVKYYEKNKHILDWKNNYQMDMFMQRCALDLIENEDIDIMFIHQAMLDHERHVTGIQSNMVNLALFQHGQWIEQILNAYKEKGIFEETCFIILGDHGQIDISKVVSINEMLKKANLIQTDGKGRIISYDAYCQSAGISGHIYVKNNHNAVIEVLEKAKQSGYIEDYYGKEDYQKEHLTGEFEFVVECTNHYALSNEVDNGIVVNLNDNDYKTGHATHGHLPHKGDKPPFIIYNSPYQTQVIEEGRLIDQMPTMMKILGLEIDNPIDGISLL